MKKSTRLLALLLTALICVSLIAGCADTAYDILDNIDGYLGETQPPAAQGGEEDKSPDKEDSTAPPEEDASFAISESGVYTSPDEVAAYINEYGHLPSNFIKKNEAEALGWDSSKGNLDEVAPGKSIGGDRFGNYEGLLPEGYTYTECDVNYSGGYRGAERIIFSSDRSIYYTNDHYESFTLLYKAGEKQ